MDADDKMSPAKSVSVKSIDKVFGPLALTIQVLMLPFFYFSDYNLADVKTLDASSLYNFYVGVAIMMLVGFGYLMTFLKAHGFSAIAYTMLITCLGVQFDILFENLIHEGHKFKVDFTDILGGNFAVATVLITFGGLIGKISPLQVVIVTVVEIIFYSINKIYLMEDWLEITDAGGTIVIHVFGAYFGIAACMAMGPAKDEKLNGASYNSDLFSYIGTAFLWLFWPSFVAGALPAGSEGHAIALMNTVLALLASAVVTLGLLPLISGFRLSTVPIQNATLAGGVAIGTCADFNMGPFGAIVIGMLAGALSCALFVKPLIPAKYDTCGINNLHGMPGILGGLCSVVVPLMMNGMGHVKPWHQLAGLALTLVMAIASGALTGLVLKFMGQPESSFDDQAFFDVADDKPV